MTIEEQISNHIRNGTAVVRSSGAKGGKGSPMTFTQFNSEMRRLKRIFIIKLGDAMSTYRPKKYVRNGAILNPDFYKIETTKQGNYFEAKIMANGRMHRSWEGVYGGMRMFKTGEFVPVVRILAEGYETHGAWHSHIPYFGFRSSRGGYRKDFIRETIDEFYRTSRYGIIVTVSNLDN